jgi:hypothetical protein
MKNVVYAVLCLILTAALVGTAMRVQAQVAPDTPVLSVWIDEKTGCQYLINPRGGIERRMVDNGVIYIHMGCDSKIYLPKTDLKIKK